MSPLHAVRKRFDEVASVMGLTMEGWYTTHYSQLPSGTSITRV